MLTGQLSEEIVKLAEAGAPSLIVMGLHSSGLLGPRMGSVTYRVLCRSAPHSSWRYRPRLTPTSHGLKERTVVRKGASLRTPDDKDRARG